MVRRDADPGKTKKVKKVRGKKTKKQRAKKSKKHGLKEKSFKKIQRRNDKRQEQKRRYIKVSASVSFFFCEAQARVRQGSARDGKGWPLRRKA